MGTGWTEFICTVRMTLAAENALHSPLGYESERILYLGVNNVKSDEPSGAFELFDNLLHFIAFQSI